MLMVRVALWVALLVLLVTLPEQPETETIRPWVVAALAVGLLGLLAVEASASPPLRGLLHRRQAPHSHQ